MRPLIDVVELTELLNSSEISLLDVRWTLGERTGHEKYLAGHLPGAVYVDLDDELAGPPGAGGRHPLPSVEVFTEAMQRAGVSAERPVVAYDAGPGYSAARLWWLLTDAAHPYVRVLNGGFRAWKGAGLTVETGEVGVGRGSFLPQPGHRRVVDADGVIAHLRAGGTVHDVRGADRFQGDNETMDPVAGHIPGARSMPVGSLVGAGGFAPHAELLPTIGHVKPGDVLSCGSGITASAAMLAAAQIGIDDLVLYSGSWSNWITDPSRPVARGAESGTYPEA
jgi:thiosulfate/3-mercaptopyruvate sulfurtransferase